MVPAKDRTPEKSTRHDHGNRMCGGPAIQFIGYVLENLGYFPLSNNYCLFLTTGGSGMMISYIMFGILLSIYRYQNVLVELEVKKKEISV